MTERRPLAPLTGVAPVAPQGWTRLDGHDAIPASGPVAEEVPVAFVYGARAHVVVMATPADLEDLAVGFTVTEGIVTRAHDVHGVAVERHAAGVELRIGIPAGDAERIAARARAMPARTGCGLCGVEAIADAVRAPRPVASTLAVDPTAVYAAVRTLGARQELNRDAHALHAAAFARADGTLVCVREDVGRHNALDKVIGALLRVGEDPGTGMLLVTSRASVELVQKAAAAGVGV
ncbi:MAG: formate dehydrogenase accessory sulfurtransferase FdhD, partial [Gemmatimonadetes bacterium]|nr:formate dehydrogenase accessory sulfurtransferase FdhD [Gemmatimonadota bacterium]